MMELRKQPDDNPQNIEIRYEDENIWLTQKDSVIRKFLITADGFHELLPR